MNSGKSSNCVHWLYAVETGTSTSIDSAIVRGVDPLPTLTPDSRPITQLRTCGTAATATPAPTPVTKSALRRPLLRFFSTRVHAFWRLSVIWRSSSLSSLSAVSLCATASSPIPRAARLRAITPCPTADSNCLRNLLSWARETASSVPLAAFSLTACVLLRPNIRKSFPWFLFIYRRSEEHTSELQSHH